jgi:hypothetical protein
LIIYVETNFILELAYLRSTSDNCQRLIHLARQERVALVIPGFALAEARMAWQNVVRRRNRLQSEVRVELAELARSRPLVGIGEQSQAFVAALVDTAQADRDRLEATVAALIEHATVLPIDATSISRSLQVEKRFGLSPQDSLLYAAITDHLSEAPDTTKVFVTQNARDFFIPTVEEELNSYGCKLLTSFETAEAFVRNKIAG